MNLIQSYTSECYDVFIEWEGARCGVLKYWHIYLNFFSHFKLHQINFLKTIFVKIL